MSTVPFDTYRFNRRLVDAGMPEKQAQELVIGATEAAENLATKTDLKHLEMRLALWIVAAAFVPEALKPLFKWVTA